MGASMITRTCIGLVFIGNSSYNQNELKTDYFTSHNITLSNLSPSTTYHYQIVVEDSAGNVATDADRTFTTLDQDTTALRLSNPIPATSSVLPAGTTFTTLGVTTDEQTTCRYTSTTNTAYDAMSTSFASTGSTTHSTTLTGLSDGGAYSYYVRRQDGSGNVNSPTDNASYVTIECLDIRDAKNNYSLTDQFGTQRPGITPRRRFILKKGITSRSETTRFTMLQRGLHPIRMVPIC